MMTMTLIERKAFVQLGRLLAYPDGTLLMQAEVARGLVARMAPKAAKALTEFMEVIVLLTPQPQQQEEAFTRAFDVQPQCIPYLSVFLFGEENFKRGELMAGFAKSYADAGIDPGRELPDHIGTVLRNAACFSEEDWEEAFISVYGGVAADAPDDWINPTNSTEVRIQGAWSLRVGPHRVLS